MQNVKGYILVALSAVIFGTMPLMTVSLYGEGLNTMSVVMLRGLLCLPFIYILARMRGIDLRISKKELLKAGAVCSMGSVITPILLYMSYSYVSTGVATTLHFVYPALVAVCCAVVFREPTGRMQWLCALLCCAGASLFCSFDGSMDVTGVTLAIASGLTYAVYIVALDKSGACEIEPVKYCFYGAACCAVLMLAITVSTGSLALPSTAKGWGISLLLSVSVMVVAVVFFQIGVGLIGAARASVLSTFEPITGTVIGALFFNEPFGLKSAVGTAAILASVVLLALCDNKRPDA